MYVLGVDKFIYLLWGQNLAIFAKMLVTFLSEHLVTLAPCLPNGQLIKVCQFCCVLVV